MKAVFALTIFGSCGAALAEQSNPLGKVLELMNELSAKVVAEGEVEAEAFKEYFDWCDDTAKNGQFAIDDASKQKAKLEANIDKLSSEIQVAGVQIEELAGSIAQVESELKDATLIREKEHTDFMASESELVDAVDTLDRAVGILSKEAAKNPAALAQVDSSNMDGMLQAISTVLDAAAFNTRDQKKLAALVQSQSADDDSEVNAPAAATYKSHSGGIVEILEDMKEKAEGSLSDMRKSETTTKHNFDMLKQSLEDQLAADNKDKSEEESTKAAAEEAKATAEGDLAVTKKTLASAEEELETARSTCMQVASDHESTVNSRNEELTAIAKAKTILEETSSGAVSQSYSFVQVATRIQSCADLAKSEVVTMVQQLARKHHSAALAQLASKISAVVKYGSLGGEDPFAKVKGLLDDMIAKLEKEANEEADEKAYCDEQMSKTEVKKAELEDDVAKMTSKIDTATAKSVELKEQVMALESELASLAKEQAEMDKIRSETHAAFETAKADLTLGLTGVHNALSVLREYYQGGDAAAMLQQDGSFMQQPAMPEKHSKAAGAGDSILGILEVVESDFATNLAKEESEEEDAQTSYDKMTQENKIAKTTKEQDVKYKVQESKSLDTFIAETSGDRDTTNTELAAVDEYYSKIKDRCIAKPETYEDRKAKREAEINGLKQALSVLEDETALVQRKSRVGRRSFRGVALSAQ